MTKRKSWTIFILLTLTLITLLIAPITVWYNLKHYSVYYAQHIPHKEEENPELIFILKNLLWINTPTNSNMEYRRHSHRIYTLSDEKENTFKYEASLQRREEGRDGYHLLYFDIAYYVWDETGKFKHYLEIGYNKEKKIYSKEYEEEASQKLSEIISPIIAIQPEPKLNLQWLFNWVHRDRFNQD